MWRMASDHTHLTIAEASEQFNVAPRTVRRWIKAGKLRAIRYPSGHFRIERTDVEAILRGDTVDVA